jgi:hypothetical protein
MAMSAYVAPRFGSVFDAFHRHFDHGLNLATPKLDNSRHDEVAHVSNAYEPAE